MEPYILFAMITIHPPAAFPPAPTSVPSPPLPNREVTWTAEFASKESCEAAGLTLKANFSVTGTFQYACLKK
jgi:hypothetical protein